MSRTMITVAGLTLSLVIGGCAGKDATGRSTMVEPPGESIQETPVIFLENSIHFSTPDGRAVMVEAGRYQVNTSEKDTLRLVSETDNRETLIQATGTTLTAKVESPSAVAITNEENPDQINVLFAQPNGNALEAIGSLSGVQGRAPDQMIFLASKINPCLLRYSTKPEPLSPYVYGVNGAGNVKWYRHNGAWYGNGLSVKGSWDGPRDMAGNMGSARWIFPGELGVIYVIYNTGDMYWFKQEYQGPPSGVRREPDILYGAKKLNGGWQQYKQVFSAGNGIIYAIANDGRLLWWKHKAWLTGNNYANDWDGPKQVGSGWQNFTHVFSGGYGVIYAVTNQGAVKWYHHKRFLDGVSDWAGPFDVNNGWTNYTRMFSAGKGIIYGIATNGDLVWYKHDSWLQQPPAGSGKCDWSGPNTVGRGWGFSSVFGFLPYGS